MSTRRLVAFWVLFLWSTSVAPGAWADELPAKDDAATEQARAHYRKAMQAYDLGRWDEAIAEYEQAYSFRNDPKLLFNMAQAYRRRGDLKRALDLYKNYLLREPRSRLRAEVEDRIRTLQKQIEKAEESSGQAATGSEAALSGAQSTSAPAAPASGASTSEPSAGSTSAAGSTTPAAVPSTSPGLAAAPTSADNGTPPPGAAAPPQAVTATTPGPGAKRTRSGLRVAGIVTAGAGIVALAGGLVMGLRARSLSDEITNDAHREPSGVFDSSKYDSGQRAETLQWVGFGVGGALLAGGAVLYWLAGRTESAARPTVAAGPGVGYAGAQLLVTF